MTFVAPLRSCPWLAGLAAAGLLLLAAVHGTARPAAGTALANPRDAVCTENAAAPMIEDPPPDAFTIELATDQAVYRTGEPVTLTFSLTNNSDRRVTLTFGSSRPPDYRLSISSTADGQAIWSYPAGPALPALSQCTFAAGETYDLTQVWHQQAQDAMGTPLGQVPAGGYVLSGRLAVVCATRACAQPDLPTPISFSIDAGTASASPSPVADASTPPAAAPATSGPPVSAPGTSVPTALIDLCSAGRVISSSYYSYPAGWNLVGGPEGRVLFGATALYGYDPSAMTYLPLPPDMPLELGAGYLAYFPRPITGPTPPGTARTLTIPLPAGRYVLVGNPRPALVSALGADVLYTYDPVTGYAMAAVLRPGQGAWAYSANGGTLTIADPSRCTYPSDLPANRAR